MLHNATLKLKEFNPYYSAPSKNKIFRILNMLAIVSNLQKEKFDFCQNPQK